MSLSASLTSFTPLAPLLLTSCNLTNNINEFLNMSILRSPTHHAIIPSFIHAISIGGAALHGPLHLATLAAIVGAGGFFGGGGTAGAGGTVGTVGGGGWWKAALVFELGHWAFVPGAVGQVRRIEEAARRIGRDKDKEKRDGGGTGKEEEEAAAAAAKQIVAALDGLYAVQWWRMWVANLPCWGCCAVGAYYALTAADGVR